MPDTGLPASVQALLDACESRPEPRASLKAANTAGEAAAIASEHGFVVTGAELLAYQVGLLQAAAELDDETLIAVVGGTSLEKAVDLPWPAGVHRLI